jgi:hypothetical protein
MLHRFTCSFAVSPVSYFLTVTLSVLSTQYCFSLSPFSFLLSPILPAPFFPSRIICLYNADKGLNHSLCCTNAPMHEG